MGEGRPDLGEREREGGEGGERWWRERKGDRYICMYLRRQVTRGKLTHVAQRLAREIVASDDSQ